MRAPCKSNGLITWAFELRPQAKPRGVSEDRREKKVQRRNEGIGREGEGKKEEEE